MDPPSCGNQGSSCSPHDGVYTQSPPYAHHHPYPQAMGNPPPPLQQMPHPSALQHQYQHHNNPHTPGGGGGYTPQQQPYLPPPLPYDGHPHAMGGGYGNPNAPPPSQGVPLYPQQYTTTQPPAATMGGPPLPPQQVVLEVAYLPADGCCTCSCLGSGQPDGRPELEVVVDKKEMGRIEQGQTSSFFLSPGPHQITAKRTGIVGFFRSVIGSNEGCTGTVAVVGTGGETVRVCIGWRVAHCCSNSYHPYMERNQ